MPAVAEHPAGLSAESRTCKLFRALSDPTRLRLLALLRVAAREGDGEVCVCDLTDVIDAPQPTVSRHLAYLRGVGLVACRKDGAWCHYRLAKPNGPVHRRLLTMLDACGDAVPDLAADADADRLRLAGCCGSHAADCC